jgi:hypothetical protein
MNTAAHVLRLRRKFPFASISEKNKLRKEPIIPDISAPYQTRASFSGLAMTRMV